MKKLAIIVTSLLIASNVQAVELPKPQKYVEIIEKCRNENIEKNNKCLRAELQKIMDQYFDENQKNYLVAQLDDLQKTVETGELDKENPEMVKLIKDPKLLKERRAKFLNGLWESMLLETISTVEQNKVNMDS